jgi:hypothetical protein
MSIQLSKKQIEALKVELAQYGLKITVARQTKAANLTVGQALAKSKWYRSPSLASLGRGVVTTAFKMNEPLWQSIRENGPSAGCYRNMYHFPYREI